MEDGPASLYAPIFMPDAIYIFFAGLSFYLVLKVPAAPIKSLWKWVLAADFSMTLTSLVNPDAFFLTVGFALFFLIG